MLMPPSYRRGSGAREPLTTSPSLLPAAAPPATDAAPALKHKADPGQITCPTRVFMFLFAAFVSLFGQTNRAKYKYFLVVLGWIFQVSVLFLRYFLLGDISFSLFNCFAQISVLSTSYVGKKKIAFSFVYIIYWLVIFEKCNI